MSCFTTMSAVTAAGELDLTKHVNYTAGMILGVDDFTQEFAYLSGRDRWLARDALGYGTVSGLSARIEKDADKGYRVLIMPGVAVSPRGRFICVPTPQCAYLNQWLAAAKTEDLNNRIKGVIASPPVSPPLFGNELTLYVVLCYRDCATDNVPIPGEPCRNEEELSAASRVKDDFSLELRLEPPRQPEEEAVRRYIEWLKKIEISETGLSMPIEDFLQAIRNEFLSDSLPISSPPTFLQIHAADICDYSRAAFRLWVTELRNELTDRETGCAMEMTGGNKIEDCILLTELRVPLEPVFPHWKVSDTKEIEIIEENRPFLLSLRMLQEWMLCGYQFGKEAVSSNGVARSSMTLPLATITRVSKLLYEIWFNIDALGNSAQIKELEGLEVWNETDDASPFLNNITISSITPGPRNVFDVKLKTETRFMRFKFNLPEIQVVSHDMNLAEYAERNAIKFMGFDIKRDKFATIFVQVPRS
jgi:hypothetical protein